MNWAWKGSDGGIGVNQSKLEAVRGTFIQYQLWKAEDPQTTNLFLKEEYIEIINNLRNRTKLCKMQLKIPEARQMLGITSC